MNPIKNILRLPGIYVPMTLIVTILTILNLVCGSISESCKAAEQKILSHYKVKMSVVLQDKPSYGMSEFGSKTVINANPETIDEDILDIVSSIEGVSDIDYCTNDFQVYSSYFCSEESYKAFCNNETFSKVDGYPMSTGGFTENLCIYGATDIDIFLTANSIDEEVFKVTYTNTIDDEYTIILPKGMYIALGEPQYVYIGWYSGKIPIRNYQIVDGKLLNIESHIIQYWNEYANGTSPECTKISVKGYFERSDKLDAMTAICSPAAFEAINVLDEFYYPEKTDDGSSAAGYKSAVDEYGIINLRFKIGDPSKAEQIMKDLIDRGITPDNFFISADDYDYKFAVLQTKSVQSFVAIIQVAVWFFTAMIILLMLFYTIKKRRNEIYTLRLIGATDGQIVRNFSIEIFLSILFSVLVGILLSRIVGESVCYILNEYMKTTAEQTSERLSDVFNYMENNDILKAEIEKAANEYLSLGVTVKYNFPKIFCFFVPIAIMLTVVSSFFITLVFTKTNLMKKGVE